MKIGVCTSLEKLPLLCELGFDYIEPAFNWLTALDEAAFLEKTAYLERFDIAAEAYNCFFPGGFTIYSPDGNQDEQLKAVEAYARLGFARAKAWGGKMAVIGSGWVRKIPDEMTKDAVDGQFARVLAVCGEVADQYGMRVAVEPLSFNECNYIHTVAQGAKLARLSGHPAAGVNVDFYHLTKNNDPLASLPDSADRLWHAHLARPADRKAPAMEDEALLSTWAYALKACPGVERISLECGWSDAELIETRKVMELFHSV